jgi:DNA-directed RNA polymerase specialized sigma24 family protein
LVTFPPSLLQLASRRTEGHPPDPGQRVAQLLTPRQGLREGFCDGVVSDWLRRQDRREPASYPSFDPDERAIVWGAIESLPWRQPAAIVLRYYEDLPQSEISELLRCSVGATESLLSRAIATLRAAMTEEDVR